MMLPHIAGRAPAKFEIPDVPRHFEPYVADCFANAYAAVLKHYGHAPELLLADYVSFMYQPETGFVGVNYLYQYSNSVEFTEEELNSSWEFGYLPATYVFDPEHPPQTPPAGENRFHMHMMMHDDPEVAYARTIHRISTGIPFVAIVNMFDMPYHRAYGKEHGIHAVVLTGYDEEKREFRLFDRYPISSSDFDGVLPMEIVMAARSSESRIENPVSGTIGRYIRHLWSEIHVHPSFQPQLEQVRAIFSKSYLRMKGLQPVHGRVCGLERMEDLRQDVLAKQGKPFDEQETFRFRTYYTRFFKNFARQRRRFQAFIEAAETYGFVLPADLKEAVAAQLEAAAVRWEVAANLSLKVGITRKPALLEELGGVIGTIRDTESLLTEQLGECASRVTVRDPA